MPTPLLHRHLTTLTLNVGFDRMTTIGATPAGLRRIVPVDAGKFSGDRLNGIVLPGGADWVLNRADGVMVIDVRLALRTGDGSNIYLTYAGRFRAPPEAMARFAKGALLAPEDYSLAVIARFECGDPAYAWLNDMIVVGTGRQTRTGPVYTLYEIG